MTDEELVASATGRPRSLSLFAVFLTIGLVALAFIWATVQQRSVGSLSVTYGPIESRTTIMHWIDIGYFASHGLLRPVPGDKLLYRSETGAFMISSFLVEKTWLALTGRYGWRLLALHNMLFLLFTSALFALLGYRFARRCGADARSAFVLAVGGQMVWFTFPSNLTLFWQMSAEAYCLFAVMVFFLLEERVLDGRRTRLNAALQALAVFALTYIEYVAGTMFVASYLATVLLLRDERPPLKRLAVALLLPWICAFVVYGLQMNGARNERLRTGVIVRGSTFQYRSGLDGDSMFYGDHLDIALGRDIVRNGHADNPQFLYRWPWLFAAGLAAAIATIAVFVNGRAPRIVAVALFAMLGTYLLCAAVFSQGVALHPYHYDVLLATPLILALFAIVPVLVERQTSRTGAIIVIALLGAIWLSFFQLRIYALCYPAPQPPGALAPTHASRS